MDRSQSEEPPSVRERNNSLPGTMIIAGAVAQRIYLKKSQLFPIYRVLLVEKDAVAPSRCIYGLHKGVSGIG